MSKWPIIKINLETNNIDYVKLAKTSNKTQQLLCINKHLNQISEHKKVVKNIYW